MSERQRQIETALQMLRYARELLVEASAPRAADKVRLAIKSTEGTRRHAKGDAPEWVRKWRGQDHEADPD